MNEPHGGMGGPSHATPLAHLRTFLATYRPYMWTVVLYAAGVGVFALATPVAVQALVNTAAFGTVLQPLIVLVALLFLGLVLVCVLKALKSWAVEVLQRRIFMDVVARLAHVLPRVDPGCAVRTGMGHPVHRFFELFSIHKAAASLLLGGVDVALAAIVGLVVLAFYHPWLLAFDAVLVLAMLFVVFGLGFGGTRTAITESSAKYAIADFLAEVDRSPYAFRCAAGRDYARSRLDALSATYLQERASHYRVVLRQFIGALATQAIASAALLGLGGFLVLERELTLGQLVAAELIVTTVVAALSDLGKYLETYYDLVAGVYKLDGLLDLDVESEADEAGEEHVLQGPAEVVVREANLAVAGRALFADAELKLERRERVRVSGPAESGKTTLLELLFGLRRLERGTISIDGVDSRELSREALRDRVAIVRGPEVVPGNVIENVRLGRTDITPGKVRAMLDAMGLSEELQRLPNGLDTVLGPGGAKLSDSQAFRLTLARALARSPGLLAVDADLTAIDARSLSRVMTFVTRPEAPWTLLIIGEPPREVARICTRHLRLDGGKFLEEVTQ